MRILISRQNKDGVPVKKEQLHVKLSIERMLVVYSFFPSLSTAENEIVLPTSRNAPVVRGKRGLAVALT